MGHPLWYPFGVHSVWRFPPTMPGIVWRALLCIALLCASVTAMPSSLEQSMFCFVPTSDVSAAFAKAMSSVSYASARLVTAAQDTRAWDLFLTAFTECPPRTLCGLVSRVMVRNLRHTQGDHGGANWPN